MVGFHDNGRALWLCICDCGNEATVSAQGLAQNSGSTKSCGCLLIEKNRSRPVRGPTNLAHGESANKSGAKSPEYVTWTSMRQRCLDKNHSAYKNYGAIGISVCDRWDSFETFISDMGRRPAKNYSIDRINPKGDYTPENCRWADEKMQQSNRTNNKYAVINGERITGSDAARKTGIPPRTIFNWLKKISPHEDISDMVNERISI